MSLFQRPRLLTNYRDFFTLITFEKIYDIALERHPNLEYRLASTELPKLREDLVVIPDDRWLSGMARSVFNAGFNWYIVGKMWPGFETVFDGFQIGPCSMLNDDDLSRLISDKRIVRSGRKIRSVQQNATFISDLISEVGSAGAYFSDWPAEDYVGLLTTLKKRGARLGGNSGAYFLRRMGIDGFILSRDVTARLITEGVIDKPASSQRDLASVQDAFSRWQEQSGRSLSEISRVLGFSHG
jgi:3-methyladenine DNA glycosylase Tag